VATHSGVVAAAPAHGPCGNGPRFEDNPLWSERLGALGIFADASKWLGPWVVSRRSADDMEHLEGLVTARD
jgi:hypothetical protein